MNGEAGVVLRRILAEDKCDVLVRGEDGEEDGFCKTCNSWVDLSRFYNIDGYYQPCKDCYVCDDDLTYSDTDDDNEYMNEPMDCWVCKRTDIPRKDLHWNTGGGSYTDTCEKCFQEEAEYKRREAEKCRVIDNEEGVFEIPDFIKPCKTPCVPRPMNGRSWWKLNGFNFDCYCAWNVEKEKRNLVYSDEDDEDEDECFSKHCCNTENLKLGKCWSRTKQATTEELICEECWEQETKQKCVACCETYTHDQLKLMPEQYPWGSCSDGAYYNFFCVDCIKDINAKR